MSLKQDYFKLVILSMLALCYAGEVSGQWEKISGLVFNDVCFVDANSGYAVGEYGDILKTSDGGISW